MQEAKYQNISIIGDGGMGTVMGMLLCEKGLRPRMWGYDRVQLMEIAEVRENRRFLPGYAIPEELVFEPDDKRIIVGADLIVSAVPCQYMRSVWQRLRPHFRETVPIVSVTKGIENDTLLRPTQILGQILGESGQYAVLSGPTIADELARKLPATACSAAENRDLAETVQHIFSDSIEWLRVYSNVDIIGVELAGAMKNVIAIAAGIIDGVGLGDNAKAALLTRGLAEITRLGLAMGAKQETFAGLTGLGDLVTTCISPTGRNRSFGERIGKGTSVEQARLATNSVVEGIATCESVVALAKEHGIEMPITEAIYHVIFDGKSVQAALNDLMSRRLRAE